MSNVSQVIIEFSDEKGITERLSRVGIEAAADRSLNAVKTAMTTIQSMAGYMFTTINTMSAKPDQSEFEFGIVFKAEAGAVIAKAASEASVKVKLIWKSADKSSAK